MSSKEILRKEIEKIALEIIKTFCPWVTSIKDLKKWIKNISNNIFLDKLKIILTKVKIDSSEWEKISNKFKKDTDGFENNVRQLIFTINAINETKIFDVYANLLKAYAVDSLSKKEFFRLTWILANIYYDDLMEMNKIKVTDEINENEFTTQCFNLKLIEKTSMNKPITAGDFDKGTINKYRINGLGMKMIYCGLDKERLVNYEN